MVLHGRDHPRFVPIGPIVTEVIAFPILGTWWDATLKSIDYNVAITFILNNNNNNATTEVASQSVRLERGGRIPSCSQYWKCYNSSYDWTDWNDSWVVASKQHLCCKTDSLVLVVTANRTVNVLVLWGVKIKNIHNFHETWMTVPLWYKKNIKSGRKTANINTKKLRSFITVKAQCAWHI